MIMAWERSYLDMMPIVSGNRKAIPLQRCSDKIRKLATKLQYWMVPRER